MTLYEHSVKAGKWLFRRRGYLPLFSVLVLIPAFLQFSYPEASHTYDLVWEMICLSVSFFGLFIRCYTCGYAPKGTSGRNTKKQKADSLNTTGIYSLTRNPLYFGNFCICLGLTMFVHLWWITLIYILLFWLYYERIILAEEEFLNRKYGKDYQDYANHTSIFIPSFKNRQPPDMPFSFRTVLKREHSSFFAVIASFTALEVAGDYFVNKKITIDNIWLCLFLGGFGIYLALAILKKRTKLLHLEGR